MARLAAITGEQTIFLYQMEICTRESAYFSFVDLHNSSILPY